MSNPPFELPPAKSSVIERSSITFEFPDLQGTVRDIQHNNPYGTLLRFDAESLDTSDDLPIPELEVNYSFDDNKTLIYGMVSFSPHVLDPGTAPGSWMNQTIESISAKIHDDGGNPRINAHDPNVMYIPYDETFELTVHTTDTDEDMCRVSVVVKPKDNDTDMPQSVESTLRSFFNVYATVYDAVIETHDLDPVPHIIRLTPRAYDVTQEAPIPSREIMLDGEISFDQIGGLRQAKSRLQSLAQMFREPEAAAMYNVTPTSFLLHGPPGTGKTSLIEAFAHECQAALVQITSADVVDKWVGYSSKNIKQVFDEARKSGSRTVLFFDEFDSLGKSGHLGTHERVDMRNIIKSELSSLPAHVIVAAASNSDPHEFEAALIRSGRLEPIYTPLPNEDERVEVWAAVLANEQTAHLAKADINSDMDEKVFNVYSHDISVRELSAASDGMTGADFVEILRRCRMKKFLAYTSLADKSDSSTYPTVTQADILHEIAALHR